MPIGDVRISELRIGSLDLTNASKAFFDELNIYEDILNTYGPAFEVRVVDPTDSLGTNKINGSYDQDISIRFSTDLGKTVGFKFKQLENSNLNDESQNNQGSLHSKSYTIKGVSKEFLDAQGNYVQKSYEDKTTNIAKKILQENYKTDKQVVVGEDSKEKRRWLASNEHPLNVIQKLNDEHVASQSQSSAYAVFQQQRNGTQKYNITTYEKLFQQAPVATIKQSTTLDSSAGTDLDKRNSVMWINVGESFFSGSRHLTRSSEQTFNLTTHGVVQTDDKQTKFVLPGKEVYQGKTSSHKLVPQKKIYHKINEKDKVTTGDAKRKRAEFLSHLAQNSAEFEIPGNPDITLGSMISLQLPKKVDAATRIAGNLETQFNDKVLVVGIRHRIKPLGQTPRYTMVVKVVKASFTQGGGTA
jgi:hypothetical protein